MSFEKGLEYCEGLRIAEIFASICSKCKIIIQVIFLNQNDKWHKNTYYSNTGPF